MPRSEVISYASIVLQQCMSDCINDLTEAQVGLPLSDYPKKKEALAMLEHIAGHCTVDGFAGVDALPSIKKWIILLDLEHANPDSLLELVGEYEAGAKDDLPPTDILGLLLYTTKIGARLLNCAVAWAQTEEETLFVSRHIARMDKLIGQVLQDKPKMVDMDDGDKDNLVMADYMLFLHRHVGPAEALAEEVLAHKSVSDKVALKKNSKLKSLLAKMSGLRTAMWDYVQDQFASYVDECIFNTCRLTVEAVNNNGEASFSNNGEASREMVNAKELRDHLSMEEIYSDPVVSDRVRVFNVTQKNTGHFPKPWGT